MHIKFKNGLFYHLSFLHNNLHLSVSRVICFRLNQVLFCCAYSRCAVMCISKGVVTPCSSMTDLGPKRDSSGISYSQGLKRVTE